MNYNYPDIGKATVELLEAAGYEVHLADRKCCGRPMISKGLPKVASENAHFNVRQLFSFVEKINLLLHICHKLSVHNSKSKDHRKHLRTICSKWSHRTQFLFPSIKIVAATTNWEGIEWEIVLIKYSLLFVFSLKAWLQQTMQVHSLPYPSGTIR